jgi:hypothetical protein
MLLVNPFVYGPVRLAGRTQAKSPVGASLAKFSQPNNKPPPL